MNEQTEIATAAPKRTRNLGEIRVFVEAPPAEGEAITPAADDVFPTTRDAETWIREHGTQGETYHVIRTVAAYRIRMDVRLEAA